MDPYQIVVIPEGALINYLAVILAALAYFFLGWLWYSPVLFGHHADKPADYVDHDYNYPIIWSYVGELVIGLVLAFGLAVLIQPGEFNAFGGMVIASLVWLVFIATTHFSPVLWSRKTFKNYCLHAGFLLVSFIIMGAILGWLS